MFPPANNTNNNVFGIDVYTIEKDKIYEICESGERKGFIRVNPDSATGYDKLSAEEVSNWVNKNSDSWNLIIGLQVN